MPGRTLYPPARQGWQVDEFWAPVALEKVPGGHRRQSAALASPCTLEYVPGGQDTQPDEKGRPRTGENVPAGQSLHVLLDSAPSLDP